MALTIVHINQDYNIPKKRVPLYKDKEALAAGVRQIIRENDERLRKAKSK